MKAKINAKVLGNLLAAVLPACAKGVSITSGVHAEVDEFDRLVVTATDYDLTIRAWAELGYDPKMGALVFPGALFAKAIGTLPDGADVSIATTESGGGAVIEAGRTRFELDGFKAEEWPDDLFEGLEGGHRIELPGKILAGLLRATLPFCSDDSSRPALAGCLLEVERGRIRMVATDGHRLARAEADADAGLKLRVVVGQAALRQVSAALSADPEATLFVSLTGTAVVFVVGNVTIKSRKIDENFPDYARVIPDVNSRFAVEFERATLIETVQRCAVLAEFEKKNDGSMIVLSSDGGGLHFSAKTTAKGSSACDLDLFAGGSRREMTAFRCGINPAYLVGALRVFDAKVVTLQIGDAFAPILVTADESPGVLHVCMLMRL